MKLPNLKNKKLVELIGILLGDGSISRNRILITLNKNEIEYAKYISSIFTELFSIVPKIKFRKKENTLDIFIFNKKLVKFFVKKVGLVLAPKRQRVKVPMRYMNNRLEKFILRGYFDTDGSLVVTNNNGTIYPRLEMKAMPSPLQKTLPKMLKRKKFRFGVYKIGNGNIRIQMNGKEQLAKWVWEIGLKNPNYIRKGLSYLEKIK